VFFLPPLSRAGFWILNDDVTLYYPFRVFLSLTPFSIAVSRSSHPSHQSQLIAEIRPQTTCPHPHRPLTKRPPSAFLRRRCRLAARRQRRQKVVAPATTRGRAAKRREKRSRMTAGWWWQLSGPRNRYICNVVFVYYFLYVWLEYIERGPRFLLSSSLA
jgi:hypothetical protein